MDELENPLPQRVPPRRPRPDFFDPLNPARARQVIDAQRRATDAELAMNAEAGRHSQEPRMETLFSGPMVAAPPAPPPRVLPWMLPPRVERRLTRAGDYRVSGDQPYTQHHALDWLASNPFGIPTNWAFNSQRASAGVAILGLVFAGIVAVVLLAVVTLVPIAHGGVAPVSTPAPVVATTPSGPWCAGCGPARPTP